MKYCTILIAGLVLVACAAPYGKVASDQQKSAAAKVYVDCLMRGAAGMDDQRSDARTIALAVEGLCTKDFSIMNNVDTSGMNPEERSYYYRLSDSNEIKFATEAVLKERSLRGATN